MMLLFSLRVSASKDIFYSILNGVSISKRMMSADRLGVSAVNGKVVVRLEHPDNYFLDRLASEVCAVVKAGHVEKYGPKSFQVSYFPSSGPYMLESRKKFYNIKLVRNPYYYQESSGNIHSIEFRVVPDLQTALNLYHGRDVHVIRDIPTDLIPLLKSKYGDELHEYSLLSAQYLSINHTKKGLDKREVREAISMWIDRQQLMEIMHGYGKPLLHLIPEGFSHHKPQKTQWHGFSMVKRRKMARKKMESCGYNTKKPLVCEYVYPNDLIQKRIAQYLFLSLKDLGVHIIPQTRDLNVYLGEIRSKQYETAKGSWTSPLLFQFALNLTCGHPYNITHYCNPRYDALLFKAMAEQDIHKQDLLFCNALQVQEHDAIRIPICQRYGTVLTSLKNFSSNVQDRIYYSELSV